MVELKMIAGAFLTIGVTGAVISLVTGALFGVGMFCLMGIIATVVIFKK